MHLLAHLHPLQWAMALCALLAMLAGHLGPFAAYALLKPLPLLLCLALVWRRADRHGQPVATRWLLAGLSLSVALQALVVYAPPMQTLFHTVALPLASLLPLVALASAVLWAEELRKWVVRARRQDAP
jgi:drug/metabolite transporter (DMT)-like permease